MPQMGRSRRRLARGRGGGEGAGTVRLGVFGGTFDPIHLGHLVIAEEARLRLGLDRVIFVPAAVPPHKSGWELAPVEDRLEMVRLATAGHAGFGVDDLELRRPGPSYTADTLEAFACREPGAELFCLLGSDSVLELDTWHDPPRLFRLATFVALLRPGWPAERIEAWLAGRPAGPCPRLLTVRVPALEIAARDLRRRAADGESLRYLVPEPVRAHIVRRGLYQAGPPRRALPPQAAEVRAALRARLSAGRAAHVERVAETAVALARRHGLPVESAELAGLLHDWYRETPAAEIVELARSCGALPADPAQVVPAALHGPVAARLLPALWPGLPPEVLTAIDRHTTGAAEMTAFDCLIYVADLVEPGHSHAGVEALRELATVDLWSAALGGMEASIGHLLARGAAIDARTVSARNALLARRAAVGERAR